MNNEQTKANDHWQALHTKLQDLLAAYADDMLDSSDKELIEAHLAGCEACRKDVIRQQILSRRLNSLPVYRMPIKLHQRLDNALNEATPPKEESKTKRIKRGNFYQNLPNHIKTSFLTTASGWSVAILLLFTIFLPQTLNQKNNSSIPMIEDAINEYQSSSKVKLPIPDKNTNKKQPITWPGSHVLTNWKTTIGGAPADAFAMRNGDSVIFQYIVDETVFFNNPEVRNSLTKTGKFRIRSNDITVLAIPIESAGILMVGPSKAIPEKNNLEI